MDYSQPENGNEVFNSNDNIISKKPSILIMTAVSSERDAVLRGLQDDDRFEVRIAGVGPVSAAVSTASVLAQSKHKYSLVVSAGIGGGFVGQAEIGSIVIANHIIAADLGAETQDGFRSVDELGFGSSQVHVDENIANRAAQSLRSEGVKVTVAPILTLSTVTGSAASADALALRIPGAAAEGMEGYGVALAGSQFNVPAFEIRAISNPVGPRDREAWRIPEALRALERTFSILREVLK